MTREDSNLMVAGPGGLRGLGFLWVYMGLVAAGFAQEAAPAGTETLVPNGATRLTVESVEQRLKELEVVPNLEEPVRTELRGILQEALRDLQSAVKFRQQAEVYAEMTRGAAEQLQRAEFQKSAMETTVAVDVPADATLGKLESLLKAEQEKLAAAKRKEEQLQAENGRRQARRGEIANRQQTLKETRERLSAQLAAAADADDLKAQTLQLRLQAQLQAVDAELQLFEQELAAYAATTTELLPLELDLAKHDVSMAQKRVELLRGEVERKRSEEVEEQERSAQLAADRAQGALRPLALRNSELAQKSSELVGKIQLVNAQLEQSRKLLEEIDQQFKVTREKVDRVGLNYAIGMLLRREDAALPDVSKYRHRSREREELIRGVQLRIIDHAVERSGLTDVAYVEDFVARAGSLPAGVTQEEFAREVTALVDKQLELLATLQQNENAYFERLVDLESTERKLREAVIGYENYIDERVLWIRSSEPIGWTDVRRSVTAVEWFFDGPAWLATLRELGRDVRGQPYGFLLALLFWLILLFFQPRLRATIVRVGEKASSGSCRSYSPTIVAMAWTLGIAMFWPSLMLIVAWLLSGVIGEAGLAAAVSAGLVAAGLYYLALEFLRQICRRQGLADAHFGWPEGVRLALRRNLRWLLAATVGLVFAAATLYADAGGRSQDTVEVSQAEESAARLFILLTLVAAALFVHVILRRKGLFCRSLAEEAPQTVLCRWRRSLHALLMLVLLTLFLLAFVGYDYTVSHLGWQLFQSTLLLEILLVIAAMVNRWLVILRRRMAIEQAQQRRTQLAGQIDASGPLASITVKEHVADLEAIGEQSRRLVRAILVIVGLVGLWLIWNDVIPALNILERFELYTVTAGAVPTVITANHIVMAVVILVATVLATRNIPGLLEIAILSRLPLDAGNRYAIITVSRYMLAIVGLILVFGSIGIPWSSYQWLVAGITVGLGFGLQEIFANFVSGLIVLFEQPIRVGDVVTIGDVTGVVSRIRMRATTVTNWEHQELIVPNREFITGRLLNWTLSSTVNRVVISVGVAYGTDPDLVRQILLDIAREHPSVMDEPGPNVTFSEFGESTLNIVLRCYLPSLDDRLAVIHQLNTTAQKRLKEAGVAFAFPTRELYIRTPESLDRARAQVDDTPA